MDGIINHEVYYKLYISMNNNPFVFENIYVMENEDKKVKKNDKVGKKKSLFSSFLIKKLR